MTRTRIARAYLGLQSIGIAAWWLIIATAPTARLLFEGRESSGSLLAFAPGDAFVVALGFYIAVRRGRGHSAFAASLIAGAMLYAALYTITAALSHRTPLVGAALMTPAALASLWAAAVLCPSASSLAVSSGAGSNRAR